MIAVCYGNVRFIKSMLTSFIFWIFALNFTIEYFYLGLNFIWYKQLFLYSGEFITTIR